MPGHAALLLVKTFFRFQILGMGNRRRDNAKWNSLGLERTSVKVSFSASTSAMYMMIGDSKDW